MHGPERNKINFRPRETNDPHAAIIGAEVHYYVRGTEGRQTDVLGKDGQWHTSRPGKEKMVWTSLGVLTDTKKAAEGLPKNKRTR